MSPHAPAPRGPLSGTVFAALHASPGTLSWDDAMALDVSEINDPLSDDDFNLALYCCYELHYRGFDGVDERWEWDPDLLFFRRRLEDHFEGGLLELVGPAEATVAPE